MKHEIVDLTICRAFFAAWVFTYHVDLHAGFSAFLGPATGLVRRGYLGVDGFFLLSGLILGRVHPEFAQSFAGSRHFWGKRLARVYPVHLAVLLLLAVIASVGLALGIVPHDPGRFGLGALGQHLLLIQAWGFASQLAWNYPSWSISTEWAGYLMFPLLCRAIARCPKRFNSVLLFLCLGLLQVTGHYFGQGLNLTFADSLWRFFPEFAAGIISAKMLPEAHSRMPCSWIAAAAIAFILASLSMSNTDVLVVAGLWLLIFALGRQAGARRPSIFGEVQLLRFLGILSFAFYMSFATVELVLAQICDHESWNPADHKSIYALAMTMLTFALALTLHHLVEKPSRRLIDNWLQSRPLAVGSVRL